MIPQFWEHTGIKADMCHIGSMLPAVIVHLRIYTSLLTVEKRLGIEFKNKELLRVVRNVSPSFFALLFFFSLFAYSWFSSL